jgi:hypothetical protein
MIKHIHIAEQDRFISAPDEKGNAAGLRNQMRAIIPVAGKGRHGFHEFHKSELKFVESAARLPG